MAARATGHAPSTRPRRQSAKRSLASLRGKVVVLNFWASWCEPCQVEAPLLERVQSSLRQHDGTVLGVTYLDASPDSQSFVRRYHLTYPNLRDNNGTFARSYGTDQLPESFIINRQGRIVAISRGEIEARLPKESNRTCAGAHEHTLTHAARRDHPYRCAPSHRPPRTRAQPRAPPPRTSLPAIERQVMCVTCKIPLNVAQSPQADRERAYIQI